MNKKIKTIIFSSLVIISGFILTSSLSAANKETEYTLIIYLNGCDLEHNLVGSSCSFFSLHIPIHI